jgi:predicted Fe-Mo cluster-binding NifX family protein
VDVLTSLVVLAAVLPGYFGRPGLLFGWDLDGLAAVVILVFIGWTGWDLLSDGMRVLLDASIDFETLNRIRKILETNPLVVEVRSLTGRNAGRFRFLEAAVVLRTDDFQKAQQVREDLERAVREKVPRVEGVMIAGEPRSRTNSRIAIPLDDFSEKISRHFGEAPFFAILNVQRGNGSEENREIRQNPYREVEIAKGLRVAEWLVEQNVDEVLTREDLSRKGPGYVLGQAGVKTVVTPEENLSAALAKILRRE